MSLVEKIISEEMPEDYLSMEFRLIYTGPLKAASGGGQGGTRVSEKHYIRKVIHKQLARLWEVIPDLQMRTTEHSILEVTPARRNPTTITMAAALPRESMLKTLGAKFDRCGYKFVPLVSNHLKLSCGLEILFLRRDMPSIPLIRSGGDIDNRMKVLFDALRIPEGCDEIGTGAVKEPDENPYFYCLLEDDSLITDVAVTTDSLLTPYVKAPEVGLSRPETDVHLVITVKVRPTIFSFENLAFAT
ncbi:MAG: hypothetical protein ACYDA9_18375 [Terriglobia bacterium]